MPAHRWTVYDPDTEQTSTFPINPASGAAPHVKRQFTKLVTTAGTPLLFEGNGEPLTLQWEGALLVEEHVAFWYNLARKTRPVLLTDDLGKECWIVIETFEPGRERKVSHQWFMKFNATAAVVDPGTWFEWGDYT